MPWLPATPGYWLVQAADAKAFAEEMTDARSKRTMMLIAKGYERLAEHAANVHRLNLPTERADVEDTD